MMVEIWVCIIYVADHSHIITKIAKDVLNKNTKIKDVTSSAQAVIVFILNASFLLAPMIILYPNLRAMCSCHEQQLDEI